MKTLNKILLTGLSVLSLNNLYGQNSENLDSLSNLQGMDINSILNRLKLSFPEFSSEKVYSDNLCINLDEKIYHVTKKNEEEGIKDLIKIYNKGYEEAWLYLPEKQIWHEIGIDSDSNSVRLFQPRIKKILEENKDAKKLIFYHNHPEGGLDCQPSSIDLRTSIYNHLDFPDYKIVSKIISKEGVVEYCLNSKGKEKLKNPDFGGYIEDFVSEYFDIKLTKMNSLRNK